MREGMDAGMLMSCTSNKRKKVCEHRCEALGMCESPIGDLPAIAVQGLKYAWSTRFKDLLNLGPCVPIKSLRFLVPAALVVRYRGRAPKMEARRISLQMRALDLKHLEPAEDLNDRVQPGAGSGPAHPF